MGPGTHIVHKIINKIKPTSYNDALALKHDISYLSGGEKYNDDYSAISNSDSTFQGYVMKAGLYARIYIDKLAHLFGTKYHLNDESGKYRPEFIEYLKEKSEGLLRPYGLSNYN